MKRWMAAFGFTVLLCAGVPAQAAPEHMTGSGSWNDPSDKDAAEQGADTQARNELWSKCSAKYGASGQVSNMTKTQDTCVQGTLGIWGCTVSYAGDCAPAS